MVKIFADLANKEIEIEFQRVERDGHYHWLGISLSTGQEIIIPEKDNIPDENRMSVTSDIKTSKIVLFERFSSALLEYNEQIIAGLEPTNEENISVNVPQPYNPDEIKVRREGFSVFEINRMMSEQNDIDLNPDFQRNLVWDNSRKSALIESILLGIPIPVFYFAESKSGKYHVVDGLQRLSTIKQFMNNEFPLKKLEHLQNDCEGKYYKEDASIPKTIGKSLERKHTRRVENAQLIVNVIESASPQKVKYDIFKRLNTGGRPLNSQEVRNCVAEDHVRLFLKLLANSKEFLLATGESVSDNRMDAQELGLRFTAFRLSDELDLDYTGDMNSFLDDTLDLINGLSNHELLRVVNDFKKSMSINYHLFKEYSFRKCLSEHFLPGARKQNINKALFVSYSLAAIEYDEKTIMSKIPAGSFAKILAKELDKKGDYYRILTTGTSDKKNLEDALKFAIALLNKHI